MYTFLILIVFFSRFQSETRSRSGTTRVGVHEPGAECFLSVARFCLPQSFFRSQIRFSKMLTSLTQNDVRFFSDIIETDH